MSSNELGEVLRPSALIKSLTVLRFVFTFTNSCPSSVSIPAEEKTQASTALRLRHEDYILSVAPLVVHCRRCITQPRRKYSLWRNQKSSRVSEEADLTCDQRKD